MTMRMLIDARHREETRVAVVKGNRIEEFDFESAEHKQLKGNIYLAKVTRVEPSLQAAFVDYGGNRHGFLAFSEIHPDYYQIPREDREALLREEAEHAAEEERLRGSLDDDDDEDLDDVAAAEEVNASDDDDDDVEADDGDADDSEDGEDSAPRPAATGSGIDEKAAESLREKRMNLRRRYKIQDVIRRRQVLLVQVVKEERGNKGAALTSYLSLAGRYCVLMPNTSHGGGISRKISNAADRKRLKSIMAEIDLPKSMGCIVRTAGLSRTKVEIRRDFDYLARLWDEIREKTLASAAPALVYQDSDLIKRAIRDIYNKDIDEIVIEGAEGYAAAKQFMRLLMPSHARRVKPYADTVPLFQRALVEEQLAAMYNPVVQLKSGGYLVINPTEALVSIDINSGRSTREYGIEATAVGTNLEAAHEIARQLRLRDMAGLVVIDFIDMESSGNVRKVEKAMKAALSDDRARIQIGRISSFGLMEMSRQRLRTGVLEASTRQCPHCEGTGLVRTAASAGLSALRMLEDEATRGRGSFLTLRCSQEAAFYVLNRKRTELGEIEARYGVRIEVLPDGEIEGARMTVEVSGPPPEYVPRIEAPMLIEDDDDDIVEEEDDEEESVEDAGEETQGRAQRARRDDEAGGERSGRSKRRRRGRRGRRDDGEAVSTTTTDADAAPADGEAGDAETAPVTAEGEEERKGRRGRRGGRRRRGRGDGASMPSADEGVVDGNDAASPDEAVPEELAEDVVAEAEADVPAAKPRRGRKPKAAPVEENAVATPAEAVEVAPADPALPEKPKRTRKKAAASVETVEAAEASPGDVTDATVAEAAPKAKRTRKPKADVAAAAEAEPMADAVEAAPAAAASAAPSDETTDAAATPDAPKRGGWWQRTFGTE